MPDRPIGSSDSSKAASSLTDSDAPLPPGGAPDRWFFHENAGYGETPHRTLIVRAGEWVHICYNGRFSCHETGNWWYQQMTVNVAYFAGEPSGDVFLRAEPTEEFRAMANLW